ncbi:MAG: N-acetylglucosamine-6-phosphate deacetylase [Lachnospiraceae bacterium]|nr:N-acetylglucosamine-6-phosphate deacetylase [Lachnospiraceae bacterium]
MVIQGGKVFGTDGSFAQKDLCITDERIADVCDTAGEKSDTDVIDASGCYVVPGLIDVHFHGCVGHDFCDGSEEAILEMAKYELKCGVTCINPATMTLGEDTLLTIAQAAAAYKASAHEDGAELVGINMEGPFISMAKKGAQNPNFIHKPDAEMFRRLQKASGGLFRLCALAPEEEGAMEFIDACKDEVVISIAHTTADYDTAKEAFDRGAKQVTHLYNAMPPFSHRAPGVIGAACDSDCNVELICDGIHVHPSVIRTTFKMFGDDRIILISDSMEATGMPDGEYSLGGQAVKVRGNLATLAEGGAIAGSATNLMNCLRFAVKTAGIPLTSAIKCASQNPAKAIGIFDRYGSLEAGKYADIVILDSELNIKKIIKKGRIVG